MKYGRKKRSCRHGAAHIGFIEQLESRELLSSSLSGSQATATSGYNLTSLGTTDWIHWGRGGNYGQNDRKLGSDLLISDATSVGTGANVGGWHDASRTSTWTNGSPTATDTNDTGYIWSNGALNTGYTFSVTASTTPETLYVYAGGYGTQSKLTAHLSDGSVPDYTATMSSSGTYTDFYTLTFSAATAGTKLNVSLMKTGNITGTQGSADLIAAALSTPTSTPTPTIPTPPTISQYGAGDTTSFLSWNAVSGATSYSVYRGTASGAEAALPLAINITATSFYDSNLTDGQTYYYYVRANNSAGSSNPSNEASVTPILVHPVVPAAPYIFIAFPDDQTVSMQWTTPSGAMSYNIYRSTVSGGEGSTPYITGYQSSGFTDTGLTDGVTYYYQITAVGTGGESAKSTETYLTPIVLNTYPPVLNSITPGDGQAALSWVSGVGATDTYSIYRSTTPGGEGSTPIKTGLTSTTFTDTGLSDGTTYYYQVQGVHTGKATLMSQELAVRPINASTPVYGAIGGQQAVAASGYNLTQLGTSDWIHYQAGTNGLEPDRKSTGGNQFSAIKYYGPAPAIGTPVNTARSVSWTDGTPTATSLNNSNYLVSEGDPNTGLSFTAPADTTSRTIYVYAGGNGASTSLRAHLSDGSVADYVATASGVGLFSNFYTITYHAASAGQTLTIQLLKLGNVAGSSMGALGSVDLMGAALAVTPTTPTAPSAPTLTSITPGDGQATVNWTPGSGTTSSYSIYRSTTPGGEGSTPIKTGITGTTFTDTGLSDGTTYYYTVSASNSAGQSAQSNELSAKPMAVTVIQGSLSGQQATAAASYNLTTLGTTDWIHFGRGGSYNAIDRKASGGSKISNATSFGTGAVVGGYSNTARTSLWSDGSPTKSSTAEHGFIWSNGAIGTGFSFTVPADTTSHTLYVYAGGVGIASTLKAHLSDGSAADYVATISNASNFTNLYAITFKAASAGQTLTITLTKSANIVGTTGSVDLIAAALA